MKKKKEIFRRCPKCRATCSLKDNILYCRKCGYETNVNNKYDDNFKGLYR